MGKTLLMSEIRGIKLWGKKGYRVYDISNFGLRIANWKDNKNRRWALDVRRLGKAIEFEIANLGFRKNEDKKR